MLTKAKLMINNDLGHIAGLSSLYETEPWGFRSSDYFLNQVVAVETELNPRQLLHAILDIEKRLGRIRSQSHFGSRTIDVDILLYNDDIVDQEDLQIPHPRMPERLFTLLPLEEVNKKLRHPVSGKTLKQMISECNDPLKVNLFPEFK